MQELKSLRDVWGEAQAEADKLSSKLTIEESIEQFLALYQTFAPELNKTEALFRPEREAFLINFQQRLQRIAQWQEENG